MTAPGTAPWTLYYDGGCNLCEASQTTAGRWALRSGLPFRTVMLQEDEAIAKGYSDDAMVLETPEGVFTAADAWLKMMTIAPWYLRPIGLMAKTAPTRAIARFLYGIVAKYRIKWFGSRACSIADQRAAAARRASVS